MCNVNTYSTGCHTDYQVCYKIRSLEAIVLVTSLVAYKILIEETVAQAV